MQPQGVLSDSSLSAELKIPKSSNAFQLFWEVLDENRNAVSDASMNLTVSVELPEGTRIPLQDSPFASNLNKSQKTDFPLPFKVYIEADNIPTNRIIEVYVGSFV